MEMDVNAVFNATVAPESLSRARRDVEEELGDIEVQIAAQTGTGSRGGGQIASRERAMERQLQTQQVDALTGIQGALDEPGAAPAVLDEWDIEHDLSERRNEILLELLDQEEKSDFDRAMGGSGVVGIGLTLAALTAGAVGSKLIGFLGDYEFEPPDIPPIPRLEPPEDIPRPDAPPEPDWHPLTVTKPDWLPLEMPGGEGENTPTEPDGDPQPDTPPSPDPQPGPLDAPGPTAVPDGRDEEPDAPPVPSTPDSPVGGPGPIPVPTGTDSVPEELPPRDPGETGSPDPGPLDDIDPIDIVGGVSGVLGGGILARELTGTGGSAGASGAAPFALPSILAGQDAQRGDRQGERGLLEEIFGVDWSATGGGGAAFISPPVPESVAPRDDGGESRKNRAGERRRQQSGEPKVDVTVNADGTTERAVERAIEDAKQELRSEWQRTFGGRGGRLSR